MSVMGNEFNVILPSWSSASLFPENTPTNFTVKLAQPMTLQGAWEVAICEIHSSKTFYNITKWENSFSVQVDGVEWTTYAVEPGYYKDIPLLLTSINAINIASRRDRVSLFTLEYNSIIHKVRLSILHAGVKIKFGRGLGLVLGFNSDVFTESGYALRGVNLHNEREYIMINADIVEDQIVGGDRVNLLGYIHTVPYDFGAMMRHEFDLNYLNVSRSMIQLITVQLKDKRGMALDYLSGSTLLKLHFRKRE